MQRNCLNSFIQFPIWMLRLMLATFNPRYWPLLVQQIRESGDSTPAMLPVALFGTICFSSGFLESIPYAHPALIVLLSPWLLVSLVAATLAMYDSFAKALRGGWHGFTGSEAWLEISRANLIAGILLSVTTFALFYFGVPAVELAGIPILIAFASFLVGSLIGYFLAFKTPHKLSGKAFECVDFFLPQFLGAVIVVVPAILLGQHFDPIWIIAYIVVSAVTLAALIKVISWGRAS